MCLRVKVSWHREPLELLLYVKHGRAVQLLLLHLLAQLAKIDLRLRALSVAIDMHTYQIFLAYGRFVHDLRHDQFFSALFLLICTCIEVRPAWRLGPRLQDVMLGRDTNTIATSTSIHHRLEMLGNLLLHSLHLLDRLLWQLMIAQNLLFGLLAGFRVL